MARTMSYHTPTGRRAARDAAAGLLDLIAQVHAGTATGVAAQVVVDLIVEAAILEGNDNTKRALNFHEGMMHPTTPKKPKKP